MSPNTGVNVGISTLVICGVDTVYDALEVGLYLSVYEPVAVVTAVATGTGAAVPTLALSVTVTPFRTGVPGTRLAILPLTVIGLPGATDVGRERAGDRRALRPG